MVRVPRFELGASWTPFKRDTKLRHTRMTVSLEVSLVRIAYLFGFCNPFFQIFLKFFYFIFSRFSVDKSRPLVVRFFMRLGIDAFSQGEMAEWLKAPVLKTGDVRASVGSNPTLSAN